MRILLFDLYCHPILKFGCPNDENRGTTLVAAEELGRQWIGIDIGDEAIRVIKDRFANGTKPLGDYVSKKKKVSAPSLFDEISIEEKNTEAISKQEHIQPKYQIFEEI